MICWKSYFTKNVNCLKCNFLIIIKLKLKTIQGVKQTMTIGRIKKPIYVIMTCLVLILGTFAIALPYQEVEANDVVCDVTITFKKKGAIIGVPFQVILNNCANNSILTFDIPTRFDKLFERCVSSDDFPIFITFVGGHFTQYNCKGPFTIEIFALPTGAHNVNPAVLVVI